MITLIIKSYLTILLSVGAGSLFILLMGLYLIFKFSDAKKNQSYDIIETSSLSTETFLDEVELEASDTDMSAIAGDDVLATQLDLARAYIETGKNQLAQKILEYVVAQGNSAQQNEAQELLGLI